MKTKEKPSPQYLRIGLYLNSQDDVDLITKAAARARRSRNNWIIEVILREAGLQLGKAPRRQAAKA